MKSLAKTLTLCLKLNIGVRGGVSGKLFKTKTGELTLKLHWLDPAYPSMRPLPKNTGKTKDVEIRYRQRYVDMIVNPKTRDIFYKRS